MAMPEIASTSEVIVMLFMADSCTDAQRGVIEFLKKDVEQLARKYVRHNITQPTDPYVHYLPDRPVTYEDNPILMYAGGNTISYQTWTPDGYKLQLPQPWLRSITEIRYDAMAYAGQHAGAFGDDTLLIQGVDYFANYDKPGLCKDGIVMRIGINWSSMPRCVRVTYFSGFTAAELDDEYHDIKAAIVDETILRYQMAKSRARGGGSVGPIAGESFGHDWHVRYDTSSWKPGMLSQECKEKLEKYMNWSMQN